MAKPLYLRLSRLRFRLGLRPRFSFGGRCPLMWLRCNISLDYRFGGGFLHEL
jgi:hypothetical protein